MPILRDPSTGLVSAVTVNSKENLFWNDPKHGKIRRALRHFIQEEGKEKLARAPAEGKVGQSPIGSPPPKLEIGLEDQLICEESGPSNSQEAECANVRYGRGMWVRLNDQDLDTMVGPEWPFLNRLAHFCLQAQIRHCRNGECLKNREFVDKIAPRCEWSRFREWALMLISCQVSCTPEQRLLRPHFHLSAAANACHLLLLGYKSECNKMSGVLFGKDGEEITVDPFGVCEIICWMLTVQDSVGLNAVFEGRSGTDFLQPSITAPAVKKATREAHKLGLCQNRLWNLALVSERKHIDLPALMETAIKHPQLRHEDHDKCTAGFCRFSTLDSTKVEQLHKCQNAHVSKCVDVLSFDPELLNKSIHDNGRTVWTISKPFEVSQDKPYVAVSHVWSDGTGIGIQTPGQVNKCLFDYMANVTKRLGCEAIWWDTISIPTEQAARRKAINNMRMNYSKASCTVIHDRYLLNYEWANDGSPCVALVFSPWFTRGWTALELIMSKMVKVLFKGPNELEPVIKDLDEDILAHYPSRCSRAHWIVSTVIRRLRQPIMNVTDLMAVLKPRSTSWPRDRMIIAGLLAGLKFEEYNIHEEEITKAVIDRVARINPSSLLHGQVTIAESGGWSWCPPSLYDMPADTSGDLFEEGTVRDNTCVVDKHGVIAGAWYFRPLEKEEAAGGLIVANSSQMSVVLKIEDALRCWRYCLLLRETKQGGQGRGLLVIPVERDRDFIRCRFIGSVQEFSPWPSEAYDARYGFEFFKIGNEGDRPDVEARKFVQSTAPSAEPIEDYHWLHGKLWMGDHPFTGQLLVTRFELATGLTKGYSLEVTVNNSSASEQTNRMDPTESIFLCNAQVSLAKKSVFQVKDGLRSGNEVLNRIHAVELWPPSTIPANDRTHYTKETNQSRNDDYSKELFRLNGQRSGSNTFAAIDPMLFTADAQHPYRGVWIGLYPGHGYEFLLFHQENETRLEAIKLTGDRYVPRGAHSIIAENLKDVKRRCTEEEWQDAPVVAAKVQVAGEEFVGSTFIDEELVLVNDDEVIVLIDSTAIQLRRVSLESLLSGVVLNFIDSCLCQERIINFPQPPPSIKIKGQYPHSNFTKMGEPPSSAISVSVPGKWAVLIGIDHYQSGNAVRLDTQGTPIEYENLNGCVEDILSVEQYLQEAVKVEKGHIKKLLAPLPTRRDGLSAAAEDQPTYGNIVHVLGSIPTYTERGDLVYIHYSGCGARATTVFPQLKENTSLDKALVPSDIASGGQYLRDLELAVLLERMVDAGLVVTVVLDCCHSGSVVRSGGGGRVRGVAQVYQSVLPADLPKSIHEIKHRVTPDCLQQPRDFTMFAACLTDQNAREDLFHGRSHGVFTYRLLDTLRHSPSSTTSSEMLYRRVCAQVQDEYVDQMPFLVGNSDSLFFSTSVIPGFYGLTVRNVKSSPEVGELELSGGSVHGVRVGSEYAILPFGCDIGKAAKDGNVISRIAVKQVLPLTSISSFVQPNEGRQYEIVEGCPAVLLNLPFEEKFHVMFSFPDAAVVNKFRADWETHKGDECWLRLFVDEEDGFKRSLNVAINDMGHYEIQDRGGQPLSNIFPPLRPLSVADEDAIPRLIAILRHLAQFRAIQALENPDATSLLLGRVSFKATSLTGEALKEVKGAYEVAEGQPFYLQFENHSDMKVFIRKFDLEQELFSVRAFSAGGVEFASVEPGKIGKIRTSMIIREHTDQGVPISDMQKIFVSSSETPFNCSDLELGALADVEKRGFRAGGGAQNALQRLLKKLSRLGGHARCMQDDIGEWQTLEIRIRTFPCKPKRSVVEDTEFLGLGNPRLAILSTFESPSGKTTSQLPGEQRENCALHNLCNCCNYYFGKAQLARDPSAILLPLPSQHRLHESLEGLKRSAKGGCHFCSLILYNLGRFGLLLEEKDGQTSAGVYLLYSCSQGRGRERVALDHEQGKPLPLERPTIYISLQPTAEALEAFIKPGQVPQAYLKFSGATSNDNESHPSSIPHRAQTCFETSSPEHMDLARDWLEQCTAKHPPCNKHDLDFTPTRLLYVGTREEGSSLRLCLTLDHKKRPKYCCLSHCWGGVTDIPLLKKETLLTFLAGIDISSLPRSFQDAILITRQLSVKYLWIDSLCIIQDSPDDWAKEAAVMGKIYENGYCTIAAAEAKNSHEGCFVRRNPLNCNPVRIASLPDCELLMQPPTGQYFGSLDDRLSSYVIWLSNLPSRGWVFQEALLSPKILYFGRGLFWTCREGQASELDPLGRGMVPQGIIYGGTADAIFHRSDSVSRDTGERSKVSNVLEMFFHGQASAGNAPGRHEYDYIRDLVTRGTTGTLDYQFHQYWMKLLATYTGLKLTMGKDRLPALSGIVQNIMKLVRWKYFAGLWEPTHYFDLIWTIAKDPNPRPEGYPAPSWSWASIDGVVGTNLVNMDTAIREKMEVLIKVISVTTECHPADVTSTGQVFGGELIVEGMLIEFNVAGKRWGGELYLTDDEGRNVGAVTPDIEPSGISQRILVLPVLRALENSFSWSPDKLVVHGLGLVEKDGHFERVAYYDFGSSPEETLDYSTYTGSIRTIKIR